MHNLLQNPVYNALSSGDSHFNIGNDVVKFFDEEVSPFAGFEEENKNGFEELYDNLPGGKRILFASVPKIQPPAGWQLQHEIEGAQFVYEGASIFPAFDNIFPLNETHIEEIIGLVKLTKPGPFGKRTIEFGHYHGVFDNGKLVAMTGQRLHVSNYTELSAVCTHPGHTGKGYASALLRHQLQIILQSDQQPFLHVRADNDRAIGVYERLGFVKSRPMHFYFMKRL